MATEHERIYSILSRHFEDGRCDVAFERLSLGINISKFFSARELFEVCRHLQHVFFGGCHR